jgi:pimeloyl-ACP methyl ester carboxylesterase
MIASEQVRRTSARGLVYERRGSGRAVVMVHGWCLNRELWAYAEEALVHDYEVVTPDLPGFGGSAALAPPYDLARYAEELALFLTELELRDAVVVGFAFGAAVAMHAAVADTSEIGGLVLIGAPSAAASPYDRMPRAMKRDWPGFARASAEAICKQPQSEATIDWLGRMFGGTPLRTALATVAELGRFEPADLAGDLHVPTLYVHGADDDVVPVTLSEECAAASPTAEVAVVADSGHLVPLDQKAAFHDVLRTFLAGLNPSDSTRKADR